VEAIIMADENKPKSPVEEIRESMAQLKDAVKTLGEKGELNDQMLERVKAVEEDLKSLEKKTLDRQLSVKGVEDEKQKFDMHMALKASRTGNWKDAGHEAEIINATHKRALEIGYKANDVSMLQKDITAGTGSAGGFLLPIEVSSEIINLAIDTTPALKEMGISHLTNLGVGEYHMPKQTGRGTAYWIGEMAAPTKSTQTFDRRTLRQGRGSMDAFVRRDLADALGLGLEDALIQGSGTDSQPKGIINYTGLTTTTAIGANGGNLGIRKAAEMALNIRKANNLKGNLGFLTSPEVIHNLKIQGYTSISNQTSNTGPLNGKVPLSHAELENLVGYKMKDSTRLPINLTKGSSSDCTYVIFGDWSQVVMGMWGGLEIKMSDVASDGSNHAFIQDFFMVHVLQVCDVTIRDESALTKISDARVAIAEVV
jgi:hypothetical protein